VLRARSADEVRPAQYSAVQLSMVKLWGFNSDYMDVGESCWKEEEEGLLVCR
jgi:hypothetical protein